MWCILCGTGGWISKKGATHCQRGWASVRYLLLDVVALSSACLTPGQNWTLFIVRPQYVLLYKHPLQAIYAVLAVCHSATVFFLSFFRTVNQLSPDRLAVFCGRCSLRRTCTTVCLCALCAEMRYAAVYFIFLPPFFAHLLLFSPPYDPVAPWFARHPAKQKISKKRGRLLARAVDDLCWSVYVLG